MIQFNKAKQPELDRLRAVPGYQFRVYGDALEKDSVKNAYTLLCCGRDMLFSSNDAIDSRFMLAKAKNEQRETVLYVDRDYFYVLLRQDRMDRTISIWQAADKMKGYSLEDLEFILASAAAGDRGDESFD